VSRARCERLPPKAHRCHRRVSIGDNGARQTHDVAGSHGTAALVLIRLVWAHGETGSARPLSEGPCRDGLPGIGLTRLLRLGAVGHLLGVFLLMTAVSMALPLSFALVGRGDSPRPLLLGLLVTLAAVASLFRLCGKPDTSLSICEALLTVVAAWVASVFGSLPFLFSPYFSGFTDALFESTSGFTTTGATILTDVEVLPPCLQFWRHMSHWLGGMGIIMLGIAVLPLVGVGGKTLYNAQFAGAPSETVRPWAIETARALWRVDLTITAAEFLALRAAGMGSFDAICHTFSTLGTGGFSTRTASIAHYDRPWSSSSSSS